jgi:Predicted restriction endonuclease
METASFREYLSDVRRITMSEENQSRRLTLVDYCERFAALKVSHRKQGEAPYKPILLLSVIDLISQGLIKENCIPVSDDLVNTFNKYWKIIGNPAYDGGLHYPFFHLQSDSFWHIRPKPDFNGLQPKTLNKLKQAVEYAKLDDELFNFLLDQNSRKELLDTLIETWFHESQRKLDNLLQINQDFENRTGEEDENHINLNQEANNYTKFQLKKSLVREAFFRKAIIHIYDYQCAFCRIKAVRSIGQTIVDGAQIKPTSLFYNSTINNGISFCKNHHWAFDRGWFSINENYKILVCSDLQESSPNAKPIKDFHGESIFLPNLEAYFPSLESLSWHRKNIFKY